MLGALKKEGSREFSIGGKTISLHYLRDSHPDHARVRNLATNKRGRLSRGRVENAMSAEPEQRRRAYSALAAAESGAAPGWRCLALRDRYETLGVTTGVATVVDGIPCIVVFVAQRTLAILPEAFPADVHARDTPLVGALVVNRGSSATTAKFEFVLLDVPTWRVRSPKRTARPGVAPPPARPALRRAEDFAGRMLLQSGNESAVFVDTRKIADPPLLVPGETRLPCVLVPPRGDTSSPVYVVPHPLETPFVTLRYLRPRFDSPRPRAKLLTADRPTGIQRGRVGGRMYHLRDRVNALCRPVVSPSGEGGRRLRVEWLACGASTFCADTDRTVEQRTDLVLGNLASLRAHSVLARLCEPTSTPPQATRVQTSGVINQLN